jgi:hypothetical protein
LRFLALKLPFDYGSHHQSLPEPLFVLNTEGRGGLHLFLRNQSKLLASQTNQGRNPILPIVISTQGGHAGNRVHPQLGTLHGIDNDLRLDAHKQFVHDSWQVRGQSSNPLIEPLPKRQQVQLANRLPINVQHDLSAGIQRAANTGRVRQRFTSLDPIYISPTIPVTNPVTGRSLPRLL